MDRSTTAGNTALKPGNRRHSYDEAGQLLARARLSWGFARYGSAGAGNHFVVRCLGEHVAAGDKSTVFVLAWLTHWQVSLCQQFTHPLKTRTRERHSFGFSHC